MAAPTVVAAGALATNVTTTTLGVVAPACAADDILIAAVINRDGTANTISAPDGTWTQLEQGTSAGTGPHQHAVFWKTATGSGGTFNFTKATDDNSLFAGVISVYRGQNIATPIDATAVGVSQNVSADRSEEQHV
jgi:hypothetical protein